MALSKSLDIPVLAEGIETEGQLSILDREGCHEAQGYLRGRPACLERIVGSGQLSLIEAHLVDDAAGRRRSAEDRAPGHFMQSAWPVRSARRPAEGPSLRAFPDRAPG